MSLTRRQYLQALGLGSAGVLAAPLLALEKTRHLQRIGLQLYTVRDLMAKDVAATLAAIAQAGYVEVETAGTGNLSPAQFVAALQDNNLTAPAAHVPFDLMAASPEAILEAAETIGYQFIVLPWIAPELRTLAGYSQVIEVLNTFGEQCRGAGVQLCYHNHDFEFEALGDERAFDVMLRECDARLVQFELDLFWATHAGVDARSYLQADPERFPLCHVKDRTAAGEMVSVGKGVIDFAAMFAAGSGLQHYFVEHDRPEDSLASVQYSIKTLQALRYQQCYQEITMRKTAVFLVVFFTCMPALAQNQWQPLFNGTDLTGWQPKIRGYEWGEDPANTFRVEDGLLTVSYADYDDFNNQFGHLFFATPYSHYRLRLEYRFIGEQAPGAPAWAFKNSGVMVHSQDPRTMPAAQDFPISIEVQFLGGLGDGKERPTANMCSPGTHIVYQGEFTDTHCVPASSPTFHDDQWVKIDVVVSGDYQISHFVNGVEVMSYGGITTGGGVVSGHRPEMKPEGKVLDAGYISLQSEGHPIQFRNIELLNLEPLTPPAVQQLRRVEPRRVRRVCTQHRGQNAPDFQRTLMPGYNRSLK